MSKQINYLGQWGIQSEFTAAFSSSNLTGCEQTVRYELVCQYDEIDQITQLQKNL